MGHSISNTLFSVDSVLLQSGLDGAIMSGFSYTIQTAISRAWGVLLWTVMRVYPRTVSSTFEYPMNGEYNFGDYSWGEDASFGNEVCDGAALTGTPCVGGVVADCLGGMDFVLRFFSNAFLYTSLTFSSLYFLFPFPHIACSPFLGKLVHRGKTTVYRNHIAQTPWTVPGSSMRY